MSQLNLKEKVFYWSREMSEFDSPIPNPEPWIDKALKVYEKMLLNKKGKAIFMTGEMGIGKTGLMISIAEAFKSLKPRVNLLEASFSKGKFQPLIPKIAIYTNQGMDAGGNTAAIVEKGMEIISPRLEALTSFVGLLAQGLQTYAANKKLVADFKAAKLNEFQIPQWIAKELRKSVADDLLVCVIDNYPEEGFGNTLYSLVKELPILFIISTRAEGDLIEEEVAETELKTVARELVKNGWGELWKIKPLSYQEISEWIKLTVRPEIVTALFKETNGVAGMIKSVWLNWRLDETVYFDDEKNCWDWTLGKKIKTTYERFRTLLAELLKTDNFNQITKVEKMLAMAALEGTTFTSEAVALGFSEIYPEVDNEMLGDLFDDCLVRTETNPKGILWSEGFLKLGTDETARQVFRYSFISELDKTLISKYSLSPEETKKFADCLITALQVCYEPYENLVAGAFTRLYKLVGNADKAEYFQVRSRYKDFRVSALSLVKTDTTGWDKFLCQGTAKFLYEIGKIIEMANPHTDLQIFTKVEELARQSDNRNLQGMALYHLGIAQNCLYKFEIGHQSANKGEKLFMKDNDQLGLGAINDLKGQIYATQRKYEEAERYYKKALAIREKLLGENHPETALSYNNLAELYRTHGRYVEAEPYYQKALAIREKVFGENHPLTAQSYNNLACLYKSRGRYEEVGQYHLKSLVIREKVLGENHPETAESYNNLGSFYLERNNLNEAKRLLERALAISEKVLGENHPNTIKTKKWLDILAEKMRGDEK